MSAATRIASVSGKRVSSYPSSRVCEQYECSTVLSVYNGGSRCWVHEVPKRRPGARP